MCVCPRRCHDRLSLDGLLAPGALTLLEGCWLCLLSHVHLALSRAPCTQQVPTQRVCVGSQGVCHCSANVTPSEPGAAGAEATVRAPRQCAIACPCPDARTTSSCSPRRAGRPSGASKGCNHQSGGEAGGIASATPIPKGPCPAQGGSGLAQHLWDASPWGGPSGTAPRGPRWDSRMGKVTPPSQQMPPPSQNPRPQSSTHWWFAEPFSCLSSRTFSSDQNPRRRNVRGLWLTGGSGGGDSDVPPLPPPHSRSVLKTTEAARLAHIKEGDPEPQRT